MSAKPETKFSLALHRGLDPSITCLKIAQKYRAGFPDWYYEAPGGHVAWAEHKQRPRPLTQPGPVPTFTEQQRDSLTRSHDNGLPALLIVGVGHGFGRNGFTHAYMLEYPFDYDGQPLLLLPEARHQLQSILVPCNLLPRAPASKKET
jgi:hypothetical protein